MNEHRKRLEQELRATVARLHQVARPDELEELPATIGSIFDDADKIQVDQTREMGLVTKARLVDRVNRVVAALGRLDDGTYGICVECGDGIKAARLRALPEVERCVACQSELERNGAGGEPVSVWEREAA